MAKKTTKPAKEPEKVEKEPVQTPPAPEIVAQSAPEEAAGSVSGNDVAVNAETVFQASSAPPPPCLPKHIRARSEFVQLRISVLDTGMKEQLDVWDIVGNGALLRFTYAQDGKVIGIPHVVFVDNIRPDFDKGIIIRSLR